MTIPELTVVEIHRDQANLASAAVPAKLAYEHVQPAATLRTHPARSASSGDGA